MPPRKPAPDERALLSAILAELRAQGERAEALRDEMHNGFAELRVGFETLSEGQRETNAQLTLINVRLEGLSSRTKRAEERISRLERPVSRHGKLRPGQ